MEQANKELQDTLTKALQTLNNSEGLQFFHKEKISKSIQAALDLNGINPSTNQMLSDRFYCEPTEGLRTGDLIDLQKLNSLLSAKIGENFA